MFRKELLTICIIPLIIVSAILISGCFSGRARRSMDPGVKTGDGLFNKSTFYQGNIGAVTDIRFGNFDGVTGDDIGIAGGSGAAFCDSEGNVNSTVNYNGWREVVNLVDIGNDGLAEYMVRGSWSTQSCVLDHDGNMLWEAEGRNVNCATNDMDFGDVDGDGDLEFAVGYNGATGIRLYDEQGNRIWNMNSGNVWHVEMADIDGDGKDEIIHTSAGGSVEIRDENGRSNLGSGFNLPSSYVSHFTVSSWPGKNDPYYVFSPADGKISVYDMNQKFVDNLDAPQVTDYGFTNITPATLTTGQDDFLAIMKCEPFSDASVLLIYTNSGTLVYEEVFSSPGGGLLAVDLDGDGVDSLFIGLDGMVLEYEYTG